MLFHLPNIPFLPTAWRSQPEPAVQPWPGNPATYDDDLRESLANEAALAAKLRAAHASQNPDLLAERNRLTHEVEALRDIIKQLHGDHRLAHRDSASLYRRLTRAVKACARYRQEITSLRAANRSLQQQLEGLLYTPEQRAILNAGGTSKLAALKAGRP